MQTTTNPQLGLLDSLMIATTTNDFLERLDRPLDWRPIEKALQAMYSATTGRPPCAPLVLFKMSLLQHCYGLSDPQCEELVSDRLSWRRFVGLGLQDAVPDETTLVRFRQRLREHGLHEQLLGLVNRLFSSIRCKIEKVFGWWKRSAGYRRVRYVGHESNRLELEFKSICWNLKRLVNLSAV
jgi:IS5 family transposase